MVKRVPVPREIIPLVAVLSHVVHLLIQMTLLIAFALGFGLASRRKPGWWLPVVWVLPYVIFILRALARSERDQRLHPRYAGYLVESFNMVLFYLVPIFYSFSIIPARYAGIYQFNPVAAMVLATRNILLDGKAPCRIRWSPT